MRSSGLNIFKSRASSSPVEIKATDGSAFPKEGDVFVIDPAKVSPLSVKLELTSPLGPPAGAGETIPSKTLSCEVYGDLDKNGIINQVDADIILEIDAGRRNSDPDLQEKKTIGDVDGNEELSPSDALHIQRYFAMNIDFPVCRQAKTSPCGSLGDVTTDGKVTPMDAYEVISMDAGRTNSIYTKKPYTDEQKKRADVDGNGKIDPSDGLFILRYAANKDTTFTGCAPKATPLPVQTPPPAPPVIYEREDQNVNEGGN